jgi:hypothetical protein
VGAPVQIAVLDYETDPFAHGTDIDAFCFGFYDGEVYEDYWGDDAVRAAHSLLKRKQEEGKKYIVYAHNGGKFDFMLMLREGLLENPMLLINGRIVKVGCCGHELRDSYALLTVALDKYRKTEIDYAKFVRGERQHHKEEILAYQRDDCIDLHEFVTQFIGQFGLNLTIGQTAIKELSKFHPFARCGQAHDERFRPFYFGGRVQCFEFGTLAGKFEIVDVNSMYPYCMRNFRHPTGKLFLDGLEFAKKYKKDTGRFHGHGDVFFVHFHGTSKGGLPTRFKDGLSFAPRTGEFYLSSHEFIAAHELGLVIVHEFINVLFPVDSSNFKEFVDNFYGLRLAAKASKDKVRDLFYKLILNSAYGKFATRADEFTEQFLLAPAYEESNAEFADWAEDKRASGREPVLKHDHGLFEIWEVPAEINDRSFLNVATAASITGAARSVLMRGLAQAKRPIYCDTDSIICESFTGSVHAEKLGAWKLESLADTLHIAGKKLYAATHDGEEVKLASKGAKLDVIDIEELCRGRTIEWKSQAPNFKLDGTTKYVKRNIKKRY